MADDTVCVKYSVGGGDTRVVSLPRHGLSYPLLVAQLTPAGSTGRLDVCSVHYTDSPTGDPIAITTQRDIRDWLRAPRHAPERLSVGVDVAAPFEWTRGDLIGRTATSAVYCAMRLECGDIVVVKQMAMPDATSVRRLEREINLMREHAHENIVAYLGTEVKGTTLHVFMEYVPGGSISHLLTRFGPFHEKVIRCYTRQILQGLCYLHSRCVLHRDIKGGNVLVSDKGVVKLADFGCSTRTNEEGGDSRGGCHVGTVVYMSPEVVKDNVYTEYSDLWALGCTLVEMATGRLPWAEMSFGSNEYSAMKHIAESGECPAVPPGILTPDAHDFLAQCFHREPSARGRCTDLLRHPFLTTVFPEVTEVVVRIEEDATMTASNASSIVVAVSVKESKALKALLKRRALKAERLRRSLAAQQERREERERDIAVLWRYHHRPFQREGLRRLGIEFSRNHILRRNRLLASL